MPPLFTVTASRAASLTALRDTDTSYVALAAPYVSPVCGFTSAIFVSLAPLAAFFTFSVEEVPPVGKPDKSILATTSCPLSLTVSPLPFTYVIVTVLSAATVYVPGLICVSVSLAIFLTSPILAALESVSPPDLRLVMLLPPTSTLPPVMLTAGVLFVPPGLLLRVMEELPLEIELISFNALAKPTLIVVLPSLS